MRVTTKNPDQVYAPRQQVGYRGQLGPIPRGVVVQLEQRDREQLHVLRHREDLCGAGKGGLAVSGVRAGVEGGGILFSGICTRKSFLHSFGLVICAGMKGYCSIKKWSV